ncbi:MAG: OmpH family outer membrane protein [Rhodospirillaceae bacterium]|jgi:outer membrane protein|nr:OmpH family outer membrane protein [Rhodospirillaceae bacterium]MBT4938263.1 OmpH family outer membrane protein [Rhodospirillaceae bacterium]MBT7954447.1 OmpH family outer membrane protein [Rhodospirillaceae bacterium]
MNVSFKFLISVLILSLTLISEGSAQTPKSREIKMGILDIQRVMQKSLMAKDIARQIDTKRRKFRDEIKKEEEALRKANDELQKQRVILSPEAFAEEARKFRVKTTTLQKKVQLRNQEFIQLRSGANRALQAAIQKALTQITKRHSYNLVLRYSPQAILVRPDYLDISDIVLEQLNKNIKKYQIPSAAPKTGK